MADTEEFIQELLPSAERMALLYHLSYLSVGGFPKLTHLIREQALETQQLFGSSKDLLLKCSGKISNLLCFMFPILVKATEKNEQLLTLMNLEITRTRIDDIIRSVDYMVNRYKQHDQRLMMYTADVCHEENETEKQLLQRSEEIKNLEDAVANLEEELRKQNGNWEIQVKLTDLQQQLGLSRKDLGLIPSLVHLKDVDRFLSQMDVILIELKMFWETVRSLLDELKYETFAAEHLIDELDDTNIKKEFLESIKAAEKGWNTFVGTCRSAQGVFSVQSKNAYKFLEINLSSLSDDKWKEEYEIVMMELNKISPQYSSTAE